MYPPMVPPHQRQNMASGHHWLGILLLCMAVVMAAAPLAHFFGGIGPQSSGDGDAINRNPVFAAVVFPALCLTLTAAGLELVRRGRAWRSAVHLTTPAAVGAGTVVKVSNNKSGSKVRVDVDYSGRWLFDLANKFEKVSQPGDRIAIEWYNLDGKVLTGAYRVYPTGGVRPFTARRPKA
jgi:hypothetical protein